MAQVSTTTKNFEIFSRIQPYEYLRRFLDQNVRPDGRLLDRFRKTLITSGVISTANASAMVRLGGTTVVCGIKAEVTEPKVDTPDQGYFVPNVELSPLCSPKFRQGPPSEKAQAISEFIHQLFTKSHIIPLKDLCIESGKAVWVLHADIVCLNYDGNILDASILALVTALKDLTLPKAEVSPAMVVEADPSQPTRPIQLERFPVSSTFCIFNQPNVLLCDPNDTEEILAKETMVVVVDTDGNICRVHKNGGTSMSTDMLRTCFERARERMEEVKKLIDEAIKK
ncbi:exosome component 8, isoform CRA_f [Radiomyces spectabilis]|uniref:exosome component 8, isoform CRA_f n=1 Tax=Radiomyces spectabilis TaxID=64574 RepID=UPI00221E875C|nr:exosome component 8, isoform CRA_f [Radiomyces spectabilis]KAI8369224.1 exosome component 8, isoform CRA_f [Radiomyces spectabilis]